MSEGNWKGRFFSIWVGQQFSLFGSAIAQFAIIWWLTKETGSATVLATASLVAMLPGVILGPFAGTLVDRWNRKTVMIVADGVIALFSLVLALLFWSGNVRIWQIFLVKVIRGLGGAFHWPAFSASTSLMVPKEHLSRVAGLNQAAHGAMNIVTPPLAALLLSLAPIHLILGIDVVTAIFAILPLLFFPIPQPQGAAQDEPYFSQLRQGLRYVWAWKGALILLLGATVLNALLNPAFSLLPLLVTKHFGKGAMELGLLESAFGFGIIAGGLFLSLWGGFRRRIHTALFGMIGMGLGVGALGILPPPWFFGAILAMGFTGFMNPITNGPLMAILQAAVGPEIQGRVFSLLSSLTGAASPVGLALAGPLADLFGVQVWFISGGLGLILMGFSGFFLPALVRIEEGPPSSSPASPEKR
ncbi:MAG: MFS transporter [Candidatus Bipolaricaulaceae bacterium]